MECNKEEARRAMAIAERKLSANDYNGAKRFVNKAENLYPRLDGLKQVSTMIDVYIYASNQNNNKNGAVEADWYGILGVDPLADADTVKKQYKKLALLLHPDKNRFTGAEGAFKLVSDAWCLLSDNAKRIAYDQKRKSKEVAQKKTTSASNYAKAARQTQERERAEKVAAAAAAAQERMKRWFDESRERVAAAEKVAAQKKRASPSDDAKPAQKKKRTSASDNAKAAHQASERERVAAAAAAHETQERMKRWLDESRERVVAAARVNANQYISV